MAEPILILGANENGSLMTLELAPGRRTTIAPPPFAPFEHGLLPPDTLRALGGQARVQPGPANPLLTRRLRPPTQSLVLRQAPPPPELVDEVVKSDSHARPGGGRYCPMCKKVHGGEPRVELAA